MIDVEKKIKEVLQSTEAEPPERINIRKSKRNNRRKRVRELGQKVAYMKHTDRRSFRNENRRLAHDATTLKLKELDNLVDPVHKKTSDWLTW